MTVEGWLDRAFTPALNPLHCLGALGWFYFWIVAVSGIYLFIFFDTGVHAAYRSVESITRGQWYAGGVMRSLHRYASDAMVVVVALHMLRAFAFDKYRGSRWYSWITGVPILGFLYAAGITGYWMVWDRLAQYVAIATTEWLDWLPLFGEPIARNFLSLAHLNDRFFTLMVFLHIAVPLVMLFVMWFHLQRVSHAKVNPTRGLAIGTTVMLLALALAWPATSQGPANLATVPTEVKLDWFFLWIYPVIERTSPGIAWGLLAVGTLLLMGLPWLPPKRRAAAAIVSLDNCNGCARCANDCPFAAIIMRPRSDGAPFEQEAAVNANLCVACGICAGACPTSTPFRRASAPVPGIDLPDFSIARLRDLTDAAGIRLTGPGSVLVFGCDHALDVKKLESKRVAAISLPCIAMLPPSFIDYALSRGVADGVFLTGCRDGECFHRLGVYWTELRLAGQRDPYLRARVPRERVATSWAASIDRRRLERELAAFVKWIEELGETTPVGSAVGPRLASEQVEAAEEVP